VTRRTSRDQEPGYGSNFAQALGRTIKVLRTELDMGRRELAERAGISYSYLTEIENGNRPPSPSVLGPIADALGLRLSQLTEAAEARMDAQSRDERAIEVFGEFREDLSIPEYPDSVALRRRRPSSAPSSFAGDRDNQGYAMQPSLRGPDRRLRAAVLELERLLRRMPQDDIERILDFARRLAR